MTRPHLQHRIGAWHAFGSGAHGSGATPMDAYKNWAKGIRSHRPEPRVVVLCDEQTGSPLQSECV